METVFHLAAGDPDEWRHAFDTVETLLADEHTQADAVLVVTDNAAYAVVESSPGADAVRELTRRQGSGAAYVTVP